MAHIQRLYDFQPGTKIASSQVDAEFDQLINFINNKLVQFTTANIKYIRLNADKVIETSANGVDWETSRSSGHLIQRANGTILPQRSRLQFINMTITDDAANNRTVIQGGGGTQGQLSNPNLLINPWFQVNQRGQSSYTGQGYGYDGWRGTRSTSVIKRNADGSVTVSGTVKSDGFLQKIENPLPGKRLTASIKITELTDAGRLYIRNGVTWSTYNHISFSNTGEHTVTADIPSDNTDPIAVYFEFVGSAYDANTVTIAPPIKLELGEISTRANDPPADYGEELRKCQRYLWVPDCSVMFHPIAVGLINGVTQAMYMLQFPQRMRIAPTIVPSGKFVAYNTRNHEGTLTVASISQESCMFMFNITDETTFSTDASTSTLLMAYPYLGSKIIVSAEL